MEISENKSRPENFEAKISYFENNLRRGIPVKDSLDEIEDILNNRDDEGDKVLARWFPNWTDQDIRDLITEVRKLSEAHEEVELVNNNRARAESLLRTPTPPTNKSEELDFWQKRAFEYVNHGDLKGAIDSVVSDLNKDTTRPKAQRDIITKMGLILNNDPDLTKEKVVNWINGFG